MGGIIEEIKQQLGGEWTLDRSDNFDEALKEMGECILHHLQILFALSNTFLFYVLATLYVFFNLSPTQALVVAYKEDDI